jgi:hypothetical protein
LEFVVAATGGGGGRFGGIYVWLPNAKQKRSFSKIFDFGLYLLSLS